MTRKSGSNMTFLKHLEELRGRLIISIVWLVLATLIGGYFLHKAVLDYLRRPMEFVSLGEGKPILTWRVAKDGSTTLTVTLDGGEVRPLDKLSEEELSRLDHFKMRIEFGEEGGHIFTFGPDYRSNLFYFTLLTPYILILKAALLIGVALSIPMWAWQIWLFVAPGLKGNERRIVKPVILSSMLLFPLGAGFAYYVLKIAVRVLTRFSFEWLEPRLDVAKYMSFVLTFMLAFGVLFQMPLVIILLVRMRLLTTKSLRKNRKYAVLIIMVLAAFLTPQDPFTMLAMGLPLVLLYEISIWVSRLIEPRESED